MTYMYVANYVDVMHTQDQIRSMISLHTVHVCASPLFIHVRVYMDCQTFSNIVITHQDITQTELSKCKTNRVNLFQIQRGGRTSIEWDIFVFPGFLVLSCPKLRSESRTNIDLACFCTFSCFASEASNTIMLSPRKMGLYICLGKVLENHSNVAAHF